MKQTALVIIVAAIMLSGAATAHAGRIVISTFIDRDPVGVVAERVMAEAYKRLGLTMEIKRFPGERAIQSANAGLVDGELFRKKEGIEHAYPNLIRVPVVISLADFVVFTKGKVFRVEGWKSLLPYKVGYVRGVKAIELNLVPGTKAEVVTNHALAFQKLAAGRSDVVVAVRSTGQETISGLGLKGITILEPPLVTIQSYHYLNVKNQRLLKPLTTVLRQMEHEGIIRNIQQQVIHPTLP